MAKDRFNTRASWDSSFKYSGQMMPKEPKVSKLPLSTKQRKTLSEMLVNKEHINDWETKFIRDIISRNVKLSDKQIAKVKSIFNKIDTYKRQGLKNIDHPYHYE